MIGGKGFFSLKWRMSNQNHSVLKTLKVRSLCYVFMSNHTSFNYISIYTVIEFQIYGKLAFQEHYRKILEEIEQYGNFSEIMAEMYHDKMVKQKSLVTESSRLYAGLVDQPSDLIGKVSSNSKKQQLDSTDTRSSEITQNQCQKHVRYVAHFYPDFGGFYSSESEGLDSGSESFLASNRHVKDDALQVKETKPFLVLLKYECNLDLLMI